MSNQTPCALCGTTTRNRIQGRFGCACVECLGEAAKQAIAKSKLVERPSVTASDRCVMCGDPITKGNLTATRFAYSVCHPCLVETLEGAAEGNTTMIQVAF